MSFNREVFLLLLLFWFFLLKAAKSSACSWAAVSFCGPGRGFGFWDAEDDVGSVIGFFGGL